jgi:hypothetical protein
VTQTREAQAALSQGPDNALCPSGGCGSATQAHLPQSIETRQRLSPAEGFLRCAFQGQFGNPTVHLQASPHSRVSIPCAICAQRNAEPPRHPMCAQDTASEDSTRHPCRQFVLRLSDERKPALDERPQIAFVIGATQAAHRRRGEDADVYLLVDTAREVSFPTCHVA